MFKVLLNPWLKAHANGRNKRKHCFVFWELLANNIMLRPFAWAGKISNYTHQVPISANIVVVPYKRTQHAGPNNVACYWPTMLRPFALALKFTHFRTFVL